MELQSSNPATFCTMCSRRHFGICKDMVKLLLQRGDSHFPRHSTLAAKQYLFRQGEPMHDAYVLRDGWILLNRISEDGKRQVFRSVLPGELLGFQPDLQGAAIYSAITLLDSVICTVHDLSKMCHSEPGLALRLAWAGACDMMLTEMYLSHITHRSARERVAFMVLELYQRLKLRGLTHNYSFQFPLKQEDIADTLGLTTIHVNRTLHALREEGVFEIHKHELTILDYAALCTMVGSKLEPISSCDILVGARTKSLEDYSTIEEPNF